MRIAGSGIRGVLMSCLLAMGLGTALLAGVSAAQAAPAVPAYATAGSFGGSGSGNGQFHNATRVAVEPATGNILAVDSGNSRIQVFAPDPAATGTFLTSISTGLGTPFGIAVDRATGDVYVSETGTDQIVRYQSDGAPVPTYTVDPSFVSPAQGAGAGQIGSFASPIAVDPTTHDLLVADSGNRRVSRFTSSGASAGSSFDGADTAGGAFTLLLDLAIDSTGTIYVIDGPADPIDGSPSRIERFDAGGVAQGALGPVDTPRSITVDPATDVVLVGGRSATAYTTSTTPPLLYVFTNGGAAPVSQVSYPDQFRASQAMGLAVAGAPSHRVYGLVSTSSDPYWGQFGTSGVQAFDPSAIPGVSLDAPSAVTQTGAHLSGHVDPGGPATDAHFEYSSDGGGSWTSTPDQSFAGSGEQLVAEDLSGLAPFTEYQVRLLAGNGVYDATSGVETFTTGQSAPEAVTAGATEIDAGGAMLNGDINPYGVQTTYLYEYGETTAYGRTVPAGAPGVAGSGHASRSFPRPVRGLRPGTTYHYRLVARNAIGTSAGADAAFTTAASNPAPRAYEQVSPVDKGGATIDEIVGFQAKPDGDGFVLKTLNTGAGAESSPRYGRLANLRSSDGWTARPLDAPVRPTDPRVMNISTYAVSEDFSRAFVVSAYRLADGGVDGNTNLYRRDVRSGAYTLIATIADPEAYAYFTQSGRGDRRFEGGAKDFSWIVFSSRFPLTPGATHTNDQLYRWSSSAGLTRVSVLPDGTGAQGAAAARGSEASVGYIPEIRVASDDGSVVLFSLSGAGEDGVYLRKDDTSTIPLSVSQIGGAPPTPAPGVGLGVSRDGRYATFLVTDATPLTVGAPAVAGNLYRYDVRTAQLEYLRAAANRAGATPTQDAVFKVSDDGSHVYFADRLDPVATVSVWHDGQVDHLANLADIDSIGLPDGYAASPHGRYFTFSTYERISSYDNSNTVSACVGKNGVVFLGQCREVYVYDSVTGELACASCPADGGPSAGDARLPEPEITLSNRYPRAVTDQGEVFFDTPSQLVAGDVNGRRDVYVYQDGAARLISPGTGPFDARFADASDDGRNVFFATSQGLVGQDRDGSGDIYDARIGGGIAAQALVTRAPCTGTACAEPIPGPVGSSPAGSQQAGERAGAARPMPKAKARISVVKSSFTRSAVRVTVRVSGRGRIRASGTRVATTVRTASQVGSYTLTVPLTKKTRSSIRHRRRVKVSVKVSLTPPFGTAVSAKLSRTLGK
jgi:DNA-binding beta-propeller fold protein YncE